MIYRVSFFDSYEDTHYGFEFVKSRAEADRLIAEGKEQGLKAEVLVVETPRSKTTVLATLNELASHADNN